MCDSERSSNEHDDDDVPQLSAATMAALSEFLEERAARATSVASEMPTEDWQLSQFWYDERTAQRLADEVVGATSARCRIGCLCAPTVFRQLLRRVDADRLFLFEFDNRFERAFGRQFVFYDYNCPHHLPDALQCSFDFLLADPPFLSLECLHKLADAVRMLLKDTGKIILCTGAVMADDALRLLQVTPLEFRPTHTTKLGNEFLCYANYNTVTLR